MTLPVTGQACHWVWPTTKKVIFFSKEIIIKTTIITERRDRETEGWKMKCANLSLSLKWMSRRMKSYQYRGKQVPLKNVEVASLPIFNLCLLPLCRRTWRWAVVEEGKTAGTEPFLGHIICDLQKEWHTLDMSPYEVRKD